MEKLELLGVQNGTATLENGFAVSFKKLNIVTLWPSISTPRYMSKRAENICPHKNMYVIVHGSQNMFIMAQKWKQPKCPSTDGCVIKSCMLYVHSRISFSHKKIEVLIHATRINFENIILSERSHTRKDKYYMIPFIWYIQNRQKYRDRK